MDFFFFFFYFRAWARLVLNLPQSPRSHCRAAFIWLQHLMTQCPWRSALKPTLIQRYLSSCHNSQWKHLSWPALACVRSSAVPRCQTSPQNGPRSRNMSQIRCCLPSDTQRDSLNSKLLRFSREGPGNKSVSAGCEQTRYQYIFGQQMVSKSVNGSPKRIFIWHAFTHFHLA